MPRTAGSAVFTAAIRSAVNVAMPHARSITKVFVRDVDRSRSMARDPLGLFADVEEDRSVARPTRGSPSVELLDPQRLVADGWLGREIPTHVVEADHRELRAESLRLLGIEREDDDWRAERNDRADPDREGIVADHVQRLPTMPRAEEMRWPRVDERSAAGGLAKEWQRRA